MIVFDEARIGTIVRDDVDDSSDKYETDITAERLCRTKNRRIPNPVTLKSRGRKLPEVTSAI